MPRERRLGFSRGRRYFERLVEEALRSLPAEWLDRLENVAVLVEDRPPADEEEFGPGLLGLYHGVSRRERGVGYGNVLPDRIILYRKPLEGLSSGPEELRDHIRQTLIHELGHYFGLEEEDLRRLEEE